MLESDLSPEQPTRFLTAQQLYSNVSVFVAHHDDCYLYVSGGYGADNATMNSTDAFIIGNYDLADTVYNLLDEFADSGNASQVAACGNLWDCPVVDVVTGANKTGAVGFRYCLGGFELPYYAWGH